MSLALWFGMIDPNFFKPIGQTLQVKFHNFLKKKLFLDIIHFMICTFGSSLLVFMSWHKINSTKVTNLSQRTLETQKRLILSLLVQVRIYI